MVMKRAFLLCFLFLFGFFSAFAQQAWIRINQLGYLPESIKRAVMLSDSELQLSAFSIHDMLTNNKIAELGSIKAAKKLNNQLFVYILDFSSFGLQGAYYLRVGNYTSPTVFINNNIYDGSADFLLNYMRQQRCGYNPALNQTCHQHDGFEVYGNETETFRAVNAIGGWHDASDYLQYATTSATAVYQLLFAYKNNPKAFADKYDSLGKAGSNGIPDILDEAKWGLDWLARMNPEKEVLYHQIADDRDHASFRLPSEDRVDYGWGPGTGRPVYRVTDKPQGLLGNKNRSTGVASIAGKYASAFALGSSLLKEYYPSFADSIYQKAVDVFAYGKKYPGVCQTAPGKSPYFYEEDNWADDMELAAIQLYDIDKNRKYLNDAAAFGRLEPVSPWIFADTARHYQWYPFTNYGHFLIASGNHAALSKEFILNIQANLRQADAKKADSPFLVGTPMIWCSNNYVTALASQCHLYRQITNDSSFIEMETALVDWLFGCNPWGTSMIVGLPANGTSPSDPHSAIWLNHQIQLYGGLVDGPVRNSIYSGLIGVHLSKPDKFEKFQSSNAVYHDDYADYSTNEPTMDGTASLAYLLSSKQSETKQDNNKYVKGGIVRTDNTKKQISLIFSGHEFVDGKNAIPDILKKHNVKASFFFTGDFMRNKNHKKLIEKLVREGHYVGAHSDRHLRYCSEQDWKTLTITREKFIEDLKNNYLELDKFGISKQEAPFFLPPYEWYNDTISQWSKEMGLTIINFTPGTRSNGDYTIPEMGQKYYSSENIYNQITSVEAKEGLNGHIMLFHIGSDPRRTDKFYYRLSSLLSYLQEKGYEFTDLYNSTGVVDKEHKKRKTK